MTGVTKEILKDNCNIIIGFVVYKSNDEYMHIYNIHIDKEFRSKGYGSKWIRKMQPMYKYFEIYCCINQKFWKKFGKIVPTGNLFTVILSW